MVAAVTKMAASSSSPSSKASSSRRDAGAIAAEFEAELETEVALNGGGADENFPEPEVMITVGRVLTTAGFLPWHIRLTEIL
jgi:hypothetical protein